MGIAGLAGGLLASHEPAQHVARSFARREFVANLIKRLALPAPLRQQEELRHIGNLIHAPTHVVLRGFTMPSPPAPS